MLCFSNIFTTYKGHELFEHPLFTEHLRAHVLWEERKYITEQGITLVLYMDQEGRNAEFQS